MLIECKCGEKFPVSVNCERHKPNDESASVFVGSRKCPNPNCNLTIYIDAIIMTDVDDFKKNNRLDWNELREEDTIVINDVYYKLAYKTTRKKSKRKVLALRPVYNGERIVAEVNAHGEVSFIPWKIDEKSFYQRPKTKDGYESWI